MSKFEKGNKYLMEMDSGDVKVQLVDISTYPASGMPADYIFEPLSGEREPFHHETMAPRFPIPSMLLDRISFTLLDEKCVSNGSNNEYDNINKILYTLNTLKTDISDGNGFNELCKKLPKEWKNEEQEDRYISILETRLKKLKSLK